MSRPEPHGVSLNHVARSRRTAIMLMIAAAAVYLGFIVMAAWR